MSEASTQSREPALPPEMYRGGRKDEAQVIGCLQTGLIYRDQ